MTFYPVMLCAVMSLAGVLRIYPLLDKRTSLFFFVTLVAVVALTIARLATIISGAVRDVRWSGVLLASFFLVATMVVVGVGWPSLRAPIPTQEDVRSQIRYVRANAHAGDVIVTDLFGSFALAYYRPELHAQWVASRKSTTGFELIFPEETGVFLAGDVSLVRPISAAVSRRGGKTVWFIVTHRTHADSPAYFLFCKFRNLATVSTRQIDVGREPLYAVDVASQQ